MRASKPRRKTCSAWPSPSPLERKIPGARRSASEALLIGTCASAPTVIGTSPAPRDGATRERTVAAPAGSVKSLATDGGGTFGETGVAVGCVDGAAPRDVTSDVIPASAIEGDDSSADASSARAEASPSVAAITEASDCASANEGSSASDHASAAGAPLRRERSPRCRRCAPMAASGGTAFVSQLQLDSSCIQVASEREARR